MMMSEIGNKERDHVRNRNTHGHTSISTPTKTCHSLPCSPLSHRSHHSRPRYLTWPQLTSVVSSASNTSQCAWTWTCQGRFSTAELSPVEAPVIPHGHTSISTSAKTWPFPPSLTPLTPLTLLTPPIPHSATTHQHR